jgi:hypothetical protein
MNLASSLLRPRRPQPAAVFAAIVSAGLLAASAARAEMKPLSNPNASREAQNVYR